VEQSILKISGAADLDRLFSRKGRSFTAIHLRPGLVPEAGRVKIETRLYRYYSACGCELGSIAIVCAILIATPYFYSAYNAGEFSLSKSLWGWFGVTVAALLIGKLIGAALAAIRLRTEVKKVRLLLTG
jgi:hypothetical protein